MVVLDTHVWLWWNDDPSRLTEPALSAIEGSESVGISAISCWEVALLTAKGRIELRGGVARWIRQALSRPGTLAFPLGPKVAVDAALLETGDFPGDPADRMIYATARDQGAALITRDRQILDFDPRGTIW